MSRWVPFLWALIQVLVLIISCVQTSNYPPSSVSQLTDNRSYSTLTSIL